MWNTLLTIIVAGVENIDDYLVSLSRSRPVVEDPSADQAFSESVTHRVTQSLTWALLQFEMGPGWRNYHSAGG